MPMNRSIDQRLWPRVEKTESCWLWRGASSPNGYGHIRIHGRLLLAHRVAYELVIGPIQPGLDIDHLCRNRGCVNPAHLEPVSRRENLRRGAGFGARANATACIHGHEFSAENTYVRKDTGTRMCRACHAERTRRRNAKRAQSSSPSNEQQSESEQWSQPASSQS